MGTKDRFRLGILFNFNKGWLGGVYYIVNIIKSLDFLDDSEKPKVIIFYNKDLSRFVDEINYPYLELIPWEFISVYKGFIGSFLKRKNIFVNEILEQHHLDAVYPLNDSPVPTKVSSSKAPIIAAWFADLQHKFYPEFFTRKQLLLRELRIKFILKNANHLVASSNDVASHFKKFYNLRKDFRIHVLQFVSIIEDMNFVSLDKLISKYGIPKAYFIISNQFLKHKNHMVALRAVKRLNESGINKHLIITGKIKDYQKAGSLAEMKQFISDHAFEEQILFLGVIPRQDQLSLMKHSQAILQPSLFEGWSTVIEDAKSLQVPVIASNIEVNKEQLGDTGHFFEPHDENALAQILANWKRTTNIEIYAPYEGRVKSYARKFLRAFHMESTKVEIDKSLVNNDK